MRLSTGPQTANHFWPRLWMSARPLGGEARKAKGKGRLPVRETIVDDVDSRVFVQGGAWISKNTALLTEAATAPDSATCVLVLEGSHLYKQVCREERYFKPKIVQGLLQSFVADRLKCSVALCIEDDIGAPLDDITDDSESSTSEHDDESDEGDFFEEGTQHLIDADLTSEDIWWAGWVLSIAKEDAWPVLLKMYKLETGGDVWKGEQLVFAKRKVVERPSQGWQEDISASGAVTMILHAAIKPEQSDEMYLSGSEIQDEEEQDSDEGGPSRRDDTRRTKKSVIAPVKQDSKWALHLTVAPAVGEGVQITEVEPAKERLGQILGRQKLHYRGAEWFQTIDLMLQEERLRRKRLKKNAGIIVGESPPEGSTKDTATCVETSPSPAKQAAAKRGQGGPVRSSKMLRVSFHEGGRGAPVTHMVEVPKCHSVATFKSTVKDALADEDIFGEEIRSAKLKWTYVQSDGDTCELDISPFTEASALESSSALHVYLLLRK
ncbi:hypothetical protein KFL_000990190 [Klebsormidium nitens]|uniref:Uncharacterized protein n=1 Tax=Klebsormidium nitens TaxID=105231 RepID=A0A1Y1HY25_KLENI|nr:hypothetical protein KFL_000990190 [Klebsormidium nitens]|eukprot:GAQ82069.1 hypothetical protein KFL_000990190 [Klebsormidium nitens]